MTKRQTGWRERTHVWQLSNIFYHQLSSFTLSCNDVCHCDIIGLYSCERAGCNISAVFYILNTFPKKWKFNFEENSVYVVMFREARMFWRMEMFRRINLFRTFLGPVSTLEKRAGPVSIKEINWPFSPTRTNAPTNPLSPQGTFACFFKQEDFILASQQDFPLHPPGFLAAHQNYFLLPIRRIVSGKQVDFLPRRRWEWFWAGLLLLIDRRERRGRGSDGNPGGSFNWRQSGSDLDTLNVPQTSKIDLIAARSSDIDPRREWNHVGV